MCPPSSPPYQPVIWLRSRFGAPPCTRSNGCSQAGDRVGRVLLPPHLRAGDLLEGLLDLPEPVIDHRFVAVQGEPHQPAADLELARHPVDHLVGDRLLALVPGRPRRQDRRHRDRVPDLRHVLDRAVEHQLSQGLDHGGEVILVPDPEPERHVALRLRHQPDAHLRDDAVVRLHEELVGGGAEAALVDVPRPVARHRAHPRPHQVSVREHHLHAALPGHVGAVRQVRGPVLEVVADHASPAEVGDGDHQLVPAGLNGVVEVEPAHTGLDDGVRGLLVDLEHPVHPAQAEDHGALEARRRAAVAVVHARRMRPERHLVLVRHPHDLLDLLHRLRHQHRRGGVVVPRRERERVAEVAQLVLAGQHRVGGERRPEGVQRELGNLR